MMTSDFIAALALVVSGGSLALEIRRWFESGPKLHLTIMTDALMVPGDDGRKKLD